MKKLIICIIFFSMVGDRCFSQSKSYGNPYGVPDELWETFIKGALLGEEDKWAEALPYFKTVADKGNVACAQHEVAICYLHGEGIDGSFTEAFKYMYKAATNEKPWGSAFADLGDFYEKGIGTPKSFEEAFKWYYKGTGVEKTPFAIMDEHKIAKCMYKVGIAYLEGKGIQQDRTQAVSWLIKADEQGYREAASILAIAYLSGDLGLEKDDVEGVKWLNRTSLLSDYTPLLFYYKGIVHRDGLGNTPIDKAEALKMFEMAAGLGYTKALDEIRKFEK